MNRQDIRDNLVIKNKDQYLSLRNISKRYRTLVSLID